MLLIDIHDKTKIMIGIKFLCNDHEITAQIRMNKSIEQI